MHCKPISGPSVDYGYIAFYSAMCYFETCDFTSGVVNMNRAIQQYCHRATSVSCERLCQFILDLMVPALVWFG